MHRILTSLGAWINVESLPILAQTKPLQITMLSEAFSGHPIAVISTAKENVTFQMSSQAHGWRTIHCASYFIVAGS